MGKLFISIILIIYAVLIFIFYNKFGIFYYKSLVTDLPNLIIILVQKLNIDHYEMKYTLK